LIFKAPSLLRPSAIAATPSELATCPEFGFVEMSSFWQKTQPRQHDEKKIVPEGTRGASSPVCKNAEETLDSDPSLHHPFSSLVRSAPHLRSQK